MSRQSQAIITLTGHLEAQSSVSIGTGKDGFGADITVMRDGQGKVTIPGTSLAGCLKDQLAKLPWGSQTEASRLRIEDAQLADGGRMDVRDSVTIDRRTGSAAPHMLHSREVVNPGARFNLEISLEAQSSPDDGKQLMKELAVCLRRGVQVGGATTRGIGQLRLAGEARLSCLPLATRDAFLSALQDALKPETLTDDPAFLAEVPSKTIHFRIPWQQQAPLLVAVSTIGAVNAIPRTITKPAVNPQDDDRVYLVVPGSSLKGVFRSQAERIMRTLCHRPAPDDPKKQFQEDLSVASDLLGLAPSGTTSPGRKGRLRVNDVLSQHPIADWKTLRDRLAEKTDSRLEARREVERANPARPLVWNDHVAIDRWTGGADDGKLFADVAVDGATWQPIVLDLNLAGADRSLARQLLILTTLVLRDFAEGWLAIGHGVTRGYGNVSADPQQVELIIGDEIAADIIGMDIPEDRKVALDDWFNTAPGQLQQEWRRLFDPERDFTNQEAGEDHE